MRLDLYLVKYGYYPTRAKAQRGIEYNLIKVNDNIINKANHDIKPQDQVVKVVSDEYVSRGAYKLLTAIHHWKIDLSDKVVLDLGASTGGFSQVCIQLGAKMIYAVDVGHDQLH
jgi:23S rRNA (cytidine1920-2'-O)/16S rRNA (cytidine1409-2'-O)-methyltransferase